MLRFHALRRIRGASDLRRLEKVGEFHAHEFPSGAAYMGSIRARLLQPLKVPYAATLVTAERDDGAILGFAFYDHFPDLGLSYLEYIVTAPGQRSQGIGGALYEAMRESLVCDGSEGLLFEVNPDDESVPPDERAANGRTLRFYERYGARPLEGVRFDYPPFGPAPRLMLVYDDLGTGHSVEAKQLRAFMRKLFDVKYHADADVPEARQILATVPARPRRRAQRYLKARAVEAAAPRPGERIARLDAIVSTTHARHSVPERDHLDRPMRVGRLLDAIERLPYVAQHAPRAFPEKHVFACHDKAMVRYLRDASAKLGRGQTIYPTVFPIRRRLLPPAGDPTHAGYFSLDSFTPLTRNVYEAARDAVNVALTATDLVDKTERPVYAVTRPPGHHAERDLFGGFCYFNNAAIAAEKLSARGRVAVLDIDYHHGNGAQQIFYEREDVLTVSIHGDPHVSYPYFTGFPRETGEGEGKDRNLNLVLPEGSDDDAYLAALRKATRRIARHEPDYLVVALGLDTSRDDPSGSFRVSQRGFAAIGREIAALGLPTVLTQEGGYNLRLLGRSLTAFLEGLVGDARDA